MTKSWSDEAWDDYEYWQKQDKKTLLKINNLLKDIERNGVSSGIGFPEFLRYKKAWSRRINDVDRLVYDIIDNRLCIYSCKGHYED
jgi:toxin YoeB